MPTTVDSCPSSSGGLFLQSQRKTFYAAGNFWLFYSNNTYVGYKHSPDNVTWTDFVPLGSAFYGNRISIHWDGTYVHYARTEGENPVKYRRGIPQTNGTISWEPEREASPLETGVSKGFPSITIDSSGYPWIAFEAGTIDTVRVVKATSVDGSTWGSETHLDPSAPSGAAPIILALPDNKMYAIWYNNTGTRELRGKFFNGTSWDTNYVQITPEAVTNYGMYAALSYNGVIYLVWPSRTTYKIYLQTWKESEGWSQPLLLASPPGSAIPTIARDGTDLYVFWVYGSNIYMMKKQSGQDWTSPQVIFTDNPATYSLVVFEQAIDNKIGMAWVKSGSFLIRYDYLVLPKTKQLSEILSLRPFYILWQENILGWQGNAFILLKKLGARIRGGKQQKNG